MKSPYAVPKNLARKKLNSAAKEALLLKFVEECQRAIRGGVSAEELKQAVEEAASRDAVEEVQGS